jgi:hypothetical protein
MWLATKIERHGRTPGACSPFSRGSKSAIEPNTAWKTAMRQTAVTDAARIAADFFTLCG